ncbi:MAG: hypothetical protein FD126_2476 [Elusimicrobia bacterium]|nr:MAG: hypothetical protein FD126_2476 [Elusimicrobiota bacterium]
MIEWVNAATRGWVTESRLLGSCLVLGAFQLAYLSWVAGRFWRASHGGGAGAFPLATLLVPAGTEVCSQDYPGEHERIAVSVGLGAALASASPRSELIVWAGERVVDPAWLAGAAVLPPTHVWEAGRPPRKIAPGSEALAELRRGSPERLFLTVLGALPAGTLSWPASLNGQGVKWGVLAHNVKNYLPLGLLAGLPAQAYLLFLMVRGGWPTALVVWWAAVAVAQLVLIGGLSAWVRGGPTLLFLKAFSEAVVRPVLEAYSRFMWRVLSRDIPPGACVVDVGAASGLLSDLMRRENGGRHRAVDVAPWTMGSVPVEWYDGRVLPLADGEADVAVCVTVLHHCPDPDAVLRELRRVCRRLVIVEDRGETAVERLGHRLWHDLVVDGILRMPYHAEVFAGLAGWTARLERAGFKVVSSREVAYHMVYSCLLVVVAE